MSEILRIENIKSGYDEKVVLKDVSFEARKGELIGIIGPNGSGKTTLARNITKVLPLMHGKILYDGYDIEGLNLNAIAKKISFVPQEINTVFSLSVFDLVMMGRFPYVGRFREETQSDFEIVKKALEVTHTHDFLTRSLDEISSGEKQRVLIAKALAQEPELLILDEPTSRLDIGHQIVIMDMLKRLNSQKGITILSILHDLNIASDYCDRLILLDNGRVSGIGTPEEIIDYRFIEDVYKVTVVIKPSPATGRPHVVLSPNEKPIS